MVAELKRQTSQWWWFDSEKNSRRCSPWLQSTLADLNEKTEAILKLIEEDADSFAQRADMYYMKRPELITMVQDFYRAHLSLAEQHDQLKSRLFSFNKTQSEKTGQIYDSCSENSDPGEPAVSEVEDPEQEGEVSKGAGYDESMKLRMEMERLKEENRVQKDQLLEKDEEKREVIRQLSLSVDVLKEENVKLRKYIAIDSPKKKSPFGCNKLKEIFLGGKYSNSRVVLVSRCGFDASI